MSKKKTQEKSPKSIAPQPARKVPHVPSDMVTNLVMRGPGRCAFPVGEPIRPVDQECCGLKPIPGKDYCPAHYDIMYVPPEVRRRESRARQEQAKLAAM